MNVCPDVTVRMTAVQSCLYNVKDTQDIEVNSLNTGKYAVLSGYMLQWQVRQVPAAQDVAGVCPTCYCYIV